MVYALLKNKKGATLRLDGLFFYQINFSPNQPCDSFSASFIMPDISLKSLFIYSEITIMSDKEVIFCGILDDISFSKTNTGLTLSINGRSRAAYLLDNGSMPFEYSLLSLSEIVKRHINPYGITNVYIEKDAMLKDFKVSSNQSQWSVVLDFCERCGLFARFDRCGGLLISTYETKISHTIDQKTPIVSAEYTFSRYGVKSKVEYVDISKQGVKSYSYTSKEFEDMDIFSKKVVQTVDDPINITEGLKKISNSTAKDMKTLKLVISGKTDILCGQIVMLNLKEDFLRGQFFVSAMSESLGQSGFLQTLTLREV